MIKYWKKEQSNISPKAKIGDGTIIHAGVHIHDEVVIGDNCKIEAMAFIPNGVFIDHDVFIGPGVVFTNDRNLTEPFEITRTYVRPGAKIGANSTILAGVVIGAEAIVGAGSMVVKDVKPKTVVVGNPARVIK